MTIKEMHSWFDILQAKGFAIEFTSREKDHILNRAQIKYVNEVLQTKYLPSIQSDKKNKMVFSPTESTLAGEKTLAPLILTDIPVASSTSALVTFQTIENAMDVWLGFNLGLYPSSYTGSKVLMILGIDMYEDNSGTTLSPRIPLRYMINYDWRKAQNNVFRQAQNHSPIYYIRNNAIKLAPLYFNSGSKYFFTVIKEPRMMHMTVESTNRTDCELPDFTHDEIMAIALDDAGVATRDQTLMQLNQANKDNLTESV